MTSLQTFIFLNTDELPYYEPGSVAVTIRVEMNELPRVGDYIDVLGLINAYGLEGKKEFVALQHYLSEDGIFPYVKDVVHSFVKEETRGGTLRKKETVVFQHIYLHMATLEEENNVSG